VSINGLARAQGRQNFTPADSKARDEADEDMMPERFRNVRQTFIYWKLGYRHGKAGRNYRCPWWANRLVFAVVDMQGRTAAGKPYRTHRQTTQLACVRRSDPDGEMQCIATNAMLPLACSSTRLIRGLSRVGRLFVVRD
jgi:hypothetical protein